MSDVGTTAAIDLNIFSISEDFGWMKCDRHKSGSELNVPKQGFKLSVDSTVILLTWIKPKRCRHCRWAHKAKLPWEDGPDSGEAYNELSDRI